MGTLRKRPPPIERATDAFRCFPQVENPTLEIYPFIWLERKLRQYFEFEIRD